MAKSLGTPDTIKPIWLQERMEGSIPNPKAEEEEEAAEAAVGIRFSLPWGRGARPTRSGVVGMAAESPSGELNLDEIELQDPSPPPSLRLKAALNACSKVLRSFSGDLGKSDEAVAAVVSFLDSIVDPGDAAIDDATAENALEEIHHYLSSASSNQTVVEVLSLELPKVVVKFVALSDRCREIAESIIDHLVATCSPRDLLSILCEVRITELILLYQFRQLVI
ncbi:hypothetical protein BHE74_00007079 [Ensete ventricosum]|nr:hypothetical protein BHE74_00007079 [Ensete ventricosum]